MDWDIEKKHISHHLLVLFMAFKTRCHTVGVQLKFLTYHQQPLFGVVGRNPQLDQEVL